MKILLLTTHLDMGGIAVYTVNLARYAKKLGHEPVVVSGGGKLEEWLFAADIRHIKMDVRTKSEVSVKVLTALFPLVRLVKEQKFDVIHTQTRVAHVLGAILGSLTGAAHVTTCHGRFNHKRLGRRIFPCWGDAAIAISKSVERHLVDDLGVKPDKVRQVYNGIELSRYPGTELARNIDLFRKIGLKENVPVIGTVGRLSSVKGQKYLIGAFKELTSRGCEAQLLIVGEGPEEDSLNEQINDEGLSGKVFLERGTAALADYLSLFDIYSLPSVNEGFGLSLVEAMASGRACVASNVGGIPEIISDGEDGILVPGMDPIALAGAIELLLRDTPLRKRIAAGAKEKAFREFSIEDSVERTIKVYEKAVRDRKV